MLKYCLIFGGAVVFVLNLLGVFRGLDLVSWFLITGYIPFQIAAIAYVIAELVRAPYSLIRYRRLRIEYPTALAIGLVLACITLSLIFFRWPWQYRDRTLITYPFGVVAPQVYHGIWAMSTLSCLIGLVVGLPIDYYRRSRRANQKSPYHLVS
jgi:hypothetical protein